MALNGYGWTLKIPSRSDRTLRRYATLYTLPSTLSGKLAPALLFPPQPLPALPLPWQAPQPLCSCISMSGAPNHHYGCSPLHSHAPHAWSFFLEVGPPVQMSSSGCSPKWRERLKKINISRKPKLKKNGSTLMYDCLNIHKPVYDYVNFVEF